MDAQLALVNRATLTRSSILDAFAAFLRLNVAEVCAG